MSLSRGKSTNTIQQEGEYCYNTVSDFFYFKKDNAWDSPQTHLNKAMEVSNRKGFSSEKNIDIFKNLVY